MPSYTLNNWDGSLSNSHEHTSSQRQEKHPSPSNTIYSRSAPIPAHKSEKSPINGAVALNKRGYDGGGEGSTELVKNSPNGIPISQDPEYAFLLSTQKNRSHGLVIRTTPPLNDPLRAPDLSQPARLTFTPILESPLHATKTLTRRDASEMNPSQLFLPSSTNTTPRNNEDISDEIDAISMYTRDAEGELEDEELIVEGILDPYSPTKPQSSPKAPNPFDTRPSRNSSPSPALDSPLFTPLPSEGHISVDRLFTPDSEIQNKNPRLVMSHVEVPPLRRPKSHYRSYKKIPALSAPSDVLVHHSLQDALQGAFSHNEVVGTIPSPSYPKIAPKKRKPKERRKESINVVAGPSTLQPPSTVNANKKRRKDDNDYEGGRKGKKRSRTLLDVDLSLSGDEQIHPKVKPVPSACTQYQAETDTLLLYLGVIHPVPTPVLAYNIRFLRNFHAKNHGILPPDEATANGTPGHRYFIPPKIQVQDSEDTISIGEPLTWEEDFHLPVDDDLDDEVVFVGGVSKVDIRAPARRSRNPRPPPRPLPPKIDLAAQMRKKQNRKKQKDDVSGMNSPKPSPSANYVVATSSSSSTGLLYAENHQHNRNETLPQPENAINPKPSAKALGKRKAIHSDPPVSSRPAHGNPNVPALVLADQPKGLASNVDVFFHTYTRSPSPDPGPTSSTFVPYSNLQPVSSSFYPSSGTSADPNVQLVGNSSMSKFYRPDLVNVERNPERFLSETVLDSLEVQSKPSDLWSVLEDETTGQYAFSTIDPTLLGGQIVLPDPEPEFEPQPPTLNSEPSSPTSHRSPDPSKDEDDELYTTTTTDFVPPATNRAARGASSTSSASPFLRDVPRRLHSKRKMPDMVAIDDLDLDISSRSSSSSGYESSSSSSDVGSESSSVVVSSGPRVKTPSPVKSKLQEAQLVLPEPVPFQSWPLEKNELYCHQCRRKTRVLKMSCSCGKLFCARCITTRYPPGRFDYAQKQINNCPHCQGCCNCTVCCSKRGDKYVSSGRGRGLGLKPIAMPPPALRRERVSLGGKTNLPPPSLQLPSEPVKYWGAVYSLSGEKIASTFALPTQEGHPAVVFGLPNPEESVVVKKPKKPLQPKRVFVGVVQRHWGYSKHRRIREFVDKSFALSQKLAIQEQKKKKKKHYGGHTRWYVGHAARLFWPRKESEYRSLLDNLSPLSSLEEEEEEDGQAGEPEVLELQAEEKPRAASLGEDIVGQVIALALEACGTDSKVFPALV